MLITFVRIKKASSKAAWYSRKIGETYYTELKPNAEPWCRYHVLPIDEDIADYSRCIDADDCEIVTQFEADIVPTLTLVKREE